MESRSPGYQPLPSSDLEAQASGAEPQNRPSGSFVSFGVPAASSKGFIRMRMRTSREGPMCVLAVGDINSSYLVPTGASHTCAWQRQRQW